MAPVSSPEYNVANHGFSDWLRSLQSGLVAWLLSLFMAFPPIAAWTWEAILAGRAGDFLRLCADPFARDLQEPMLAYRVALPLLSAALHLPPVVSLALSYLCSLAALVCLHRAILLRSQASLADFLTMAVACSATLRYSHYCPGLPDSFTHLTTALAMFASPMVAAGCVVVGLLNDERAILALPFLTLWRHGNVSDLRFRKPSTWLPLARTAAPLAFGLGLGLLSRFALRSGLVGPGIETPALYTAMLDSVLQMRPWLGSWGVWLVNWLNGPGWLWVFIALPLLSSQFRPAPFATIIVASSFLGVCISTFVVADASRSIGFAFVGPLVLAVWLHQRIPAPTRQMALLVAALQVASPALWIYERWQFIQIRPLPWELWLVMTS